MTNGVNGFNLHSEKVEEGLLGSIDQRLDRWNQIESELTAEDFTSKRDIFVFIKDHLNQYKTLPSNQQISAKFQWTPLLGEFKYWLDTMKTYTLARKAQIVLRQTVNKMGENPQEAVNLALTSLGVLVSRSSTQVKAYDASATDRLASFDYRTKEFFSTGKIMGLNTGLKILDKERVGWLPGDLIGVFARPGLGKTWWLIWQGAINWLEGRHILLVSSEMDAARMNLRVDTVLGNLMGYRMHYPSLILGDPDQKKAYELLVEKLTKEPPRWWTYSSADGGRPFKLEDVRALIRRHNPEFVLLDNIAKFQPDSHKNQTWEAMLDLIYGLKDMATAMEVPIMVSHHSSNSAKGRRSQAAGVVGRGGDDWMPTINDVAYGDSFSYACSDLIAMCPEPEDKNVIWYSLQKSRNRAPSEEARYGLAADFARGKMIDLGDLGYSPSDVSNEARRLLA